MVHDLNDAEVGTAINHKHETKSMKYISALFIFISLFLVSCSSDEPNGGGEIQPDINFPDPEETVTVSLYKNSDANIDGIFIDASDKLTSNNGWEFVSLGEMKGLGNISLIPWEGWSRSVQAKKGSGYIAYNGAYRKFYRLFISNSASDEMGTITGFQVKYQQPFYGKDDFVSFEPNEFTVPYTGGTYEASFTNGTLIPISVETDCDWISLKSIDYGFGVSDSRGMAFDVLSTNSLTPSVGHIKVKTFYEKESI